MKQQTYSASDDATCSAWYVCHPDGQDLGLIAPRFATEAEAIAKRDLWNKDVPGHYIMGITEAPSEFSSLPNTKLSGSEGAKD
jgi:hypothetical protein